MGIPICLFAYGTVGLGVASAIASVIILLHFTLGVLLAKKSFSLEILIKNGPIYAILASIAFLYFKWDVPGYIENTTFLLTYTTIFLVLINLFQLFYIIRYTFEKCMFNRIVIDCNMT